MLGPTRYSKGMDESTVEVPLGHIALAAEILSYMIGRRVPVSHVRSGLSLEVRPLGASPEHYTVEVTEHGDLAIHMDIETCRDTLTIQHDQQVTAQFPIPGVVTPKEGEPYIGIVDPGHPVKIGTIWDGEYKLTRRWGLLDLEQCEHWNCAQDQLST